MAQDLGLAEAALYAWRAKRRQIGRLFEGQKPQQAKLARLKRDNARLEEGVAFLKKRRRTSRNSPSGVRHDRGSQYCSTAYQKFFRNHHLVCGVGKKGDCYDNAAMERWNHSFKVEAIHGGRLNTRPYAKHQVFECVEVYCLCPWAQSQTASFRTGLSWPEAFGSKKVA